MSTQETTRDNVIDALSKVAVPGRDKKFNELDLLKEVEISDGRITLTLNGDAVSREHDTALEQACEDALIMLSGVKSVSIRIERNPVATGNETMDRRTAVPGVRGVILVGSGKGGVGKSTVAANLAVAFANQGKSVGLLDADVYGPSIPIMFGISGTSGRIDIRDVQGVKKMVPYEAHGVKLMSIGFIVEDEKPIIWRGPMLHSALMQFLNDVDWGELDCLIIDLPPGTGDVQLSLAQNVFVDGAVIVSTPQDVAMADVIRAKNMFDTLQVQVFGLIQNMSEFRAPDGNVYRIFAGPSVDIAAEKMQIPALGAIPIDPSIGLSGDTGTPVMAEPFDGDNLVQSAFFTAAERIADLLEQKQG